MHTNAPARGHHPARMRGARAGESWTSRLVEGVTLATVRLSDSNTLP